NTSATSHPKGPLEGVIVACSALAEPWRPPRMKQAATKESNATAFRKLVSCCVPLPARKPIQFTNVSNNRNAIAIVATPANEKPKSAIAYSAKAIDRKEIAAVFPSQSLQPTTKPGNSPKA